MVKEVDWQYKIIKKLRGEGSYGRKWATQLTVGVPDLVLSFKSPFFAREGLYLCEVKLEKGWKKNTKRTIALKPKQADELNNALEASGRAFVLVVVYHGPLDVWLAPVPVPPRREAMQITRDTLLDGAFKWSPENNLSEYLTTWYGENHND